MTFSNLAISGFKFVQLEISGASYVVQRLSRKADEFLNRDCTLCTPYIL